MWTTEAQFLNTSFNGFSLFFHVIYCLNEFIINPLFSPLHPHHLLKTRLEHYCESPCQPLVAWRWTDFLVLSRFLATFSAPTQHRTQHGHGWFLALTKTTQHGISWSAYRRPLPPLPLGTPALQSARQGPSRISDPLWLLRSSQPRCWDCCSTTEMINSPPWQWSSGGAKIARAHLSNSSGHRLELNHRLLWRSVDGIHIYPADTFLDHIFTISICFYFYLET